MNQRLPLFFAAFLKKIISFAVVFLGLSIFTAFANPGGYIYRSRQSGDWNNVNSWQRAPAGTSTWVDVVSAADIPDATAGTITIRSGDEIEINDSSIADEIEIESLGFLFVWGDLTIPSNASAGISVLGELNIIGSLNVNNNVINGTGAFTLSPSGTLEIGSADGISSGAMGNIQVQSRTFNAGASYVYGGTIAQVTGNGLPNGANLVIKNAAGVTLNSTVTVANVTLSQGKLITSASNLLTVSAGGSITSSEPDSFVEGPLARIASTTGALSFPVGRGINKRPLILNIVSTTGENTYTAEQFDTPYVPGTTTIPGTITHISRIRYFTVSKSGAATVTANVQLTYAADDVVSDPAKLTIVKYSGASVTDLTATATGTASGGTVTSGDFTTFSDFMLANKSGGTNPLPVELLNFYAKSNQNAIQLSWETASEKNSSFFEIERSTDGRNFDVLGKVSAMGNSQMLKRYAFEDKNPLNGLAYYRLKQVDLDGSFAYSKIETVSNSAVNPTVLVYPNPTADRFFISCPVHEKAEIKLINMLGQVVLTQTVWHSEITALEMKDLPAGTYQAIIQVGGSQVVKTIVKTDL